MTDGAAPAENRSVGAAAEWMGVEALGFLGGACAGALIQTTMYSDETHQIVELTNAITDARAAGQYAAVAALQAEREPLAEHSSDIMMASVAAGMIVAALYQSGRIATRRVRGWWQARQTPTE